MTQTARIYSRVLVTLDGSAAAEFAIRYAADLARHHDADLLLLHIAYLPVVVGAGDSAGEDELSREQVARRLAELRAQLRADGIRAQEHLLETRELPGALYRFVETERISVIVTSTQGKTGMLRWLFGADVEKALTGMPVPLLLVRPMYQKIVVPLDGSRWSESAIPRAAELARLHNAELILLHVFQSPVSSYSGEMALAGQQEIADQGFNQMRHQLVSLRNRLRQEGLQVREQIIRSNNPSQAICEFAEGEEGINMIVMSTHGRTGLSRWLVGSVAQKVLKSMRCPVTLVYPDRT
jgi:nucleotide-binding universal stress UspA family protein